MAWDPANVFEEILRRFRRHLMETEYMLHKLLEDLWGEEWFTAPPYESTISMMAEGVTEPLASIHDEGDHILVAVMLPGARRETVDVRIHEDRVEVEASIDYQIATRAFGGYLRKASRIERYKGVYRLPEPVDPSTARYEIRGDMVVIRVRKKRSG